MDLLSAVVLSINKPVTIGRNPALWLVRVATLVFCRHIDGIYIPAPMLSEIALFRVSIVNYMR
jgi:hypothetical protein